MVERTSRHQCFGILTAYWVLIPIRYAVHLLRTRRYIVGDKVRSVWNIIFGVPAPNVLVPEGVDVRHQDYGVFPSVSVDCSASSFLEPTEPQ